ncbi:MAG: hypothetical protein KGJ23_15160 [Euryarchaeota archaeon]|nr:hypothetical protein [Euryarchaeota archaeon]MDE1837939.1 hypothetical protein [Euryarchaeota archaeon]
MLKVAVDELSRSAEGRAGGLKFNKLVFALSKKLNAAQNQEYHFSLPYRWYLHGAVVDSRAVSPWVKFQRDDDETKMDAEWSGAVLRATAPDGLEEEARSISREFISKYEGSEGIDRMLQDHYQDAPLPFQRAFLSWTQLVDGILYGRVDDSPRETWAAFERLAKEFRAEPDARLDPLFHTLILYLEPLVKERKLGDRWTLERAQSALWEFWSVYCLFLSVRENKGLSRERISYYRVRAEEELPAYQRRLAAYTETGYLREARAAFQQGEGLREVAAYLSREAHAALDGDA